MIEITFLIIFNFLRSRRIFKIKGKGTLSKDQGEFLMIGGGFERLRGF